MLPIKYDKFILDSKDNIYQSFQKNGVQIFTNIFNNDELIIMEKLLKDKFKKTKANSFMSSSRNISNGSSNILGLDKLFFNDKLINICKICLGSENLMYTSVLGIQKNEHGDWHKDDGTGSSEKGFFLKDPYDDETCRVLRIGLYFQDHNSKNPGTAYKVGSHRHKDLIWGKKNYVTCRKGDVIIFDVRLTHAGVFKSIILKFLQKNLPKSIYPIILLVNSIFRLLYLKISRKEKITCWSAIGINNENTINYSKNIMISQIKQSGGDHFLNKDSSDHFKTYNVVCAAKHFPKILN